jgi:putative component of membrane protein insertase Oxa1/YidC/SpoIIIJ protein YidD
MVFNFIFVLAMAGYFEPWGKDSDLIPKTEEAILITPPAKADPISTIAESFIYLHQKFLSPTTGPRSSFRPTSSKYMLLSIRRHGFLKGFPKGCDRLLRENSDKWCYRTISIDGYDYKFDPTIE